MEINTLCVTIILGTFVTVAASIEYCRMLNKIKAAQIIVLLILNGRMTTKEIIDRGVKRPYTALRKLAGLGIVARTELQSGPERGMMPRYAYYLCGSGAS